MTTPAATRAPPRMDAGLMCELLKWATATGDGRLELPDETAIDPVVAATLGFLVEQHWLAENGTRSGSSGMSSTNCRTGVGCSISSHRTGLERGSIMARLGDSRSRRNISTLGTPHFP